MPNHSPENFSPLARRAWTYPLAAALYTLILFSLLLPPLLAGQVVANHDNAAAVGLPESAEPAPDHKFDDLPDFFLPEIRQNLTGTRRGWLTTWTPWTEFGRPTAQLGGDGAVWLPLWLLSKVTHDELYYLTISSFSAVYLAGLFLLLFLREHWLHPLACAAASIAFATSPVLFYWLTFPVFLWTFCWSTAVLWLVAAASRRPSVAIWFALAFAVYSLLLTGYPQLIVHQAYILGAYALFRIAAGSARVRSSVFLLSAAVVGTICALPPYLDLWTLLKDSPRASVPTSWFVAVLPHIHGLRDCLNFALLSYSPFWFGHPMSPSFTPDFNGFSFTPIFWSFLLAALVLPPIRRYWPWALAFTLCIAATLCAPLYAFLVDHAPAFRFSRCQTLDAGVLPAFILIASALDYLLRVRPPNWRRPLALILLAATVYAAFFTAADTDRLGLKLVPGNAALLAIEAAFLILLYGTFRGSRWAILFIAVALPYVYSPRLMLLQPRTAFDTTSPLVDAIARNLPAGSRYAIASDRPLPILPPNTEALIRLPSVHTYDSLLSTAYVHHMQKLGSPIQQYARIFPTIGGDFPTRNPAFSFSDIGLILAPDPLSDPGLRLVDQIGSLRLYAPLRRPVAFARLDVAPAENSISLAGFLDQQPRLDASLQSDQGDACDFTFQPVDRPTFLFVSRQFHPTWTAQARIGTQSQPARIVRVNELFTGVIVPPMATAIDLNFRPWVSLSFVPMLFFTGGAIVCLAWTWRKKKGRPSGRKG